MGPSFSGLDQFLINTGAIIHWIGPVFNESAGAIIHSNVPVLKIVKKFLNGPVFNE
jgi:hypothetical protein